jgi:hypothetical protein
VAPAVDGAPARRSATRCGDRAADFLAVIALFISPRNSGCVRRIANPIRWSLAPSWAELDPRRFLGTLTELPSTAAPGEWCRIVLVHEHGELCWTLVADDMERTAAMFLERRPGRPLRDALGWSSEQPVGPNNSTCSSS